RRHARVGRDGRGERIGAGAGQDATGGPPAGWPDSFLRRRATVDRRGDSPFGRQSERSGAPARPVLQDAALSGGEIRARARRRVRRRTPRSARMTRTMRRRLLTTAAALAYGLLQWLRWPEPLALDQSLFALYGRWLGRGLVLYRD